MWRYAVKSSLDSWATEAPVGVCIVSVLRGWDGITSVPAHRRSTLGLECRGKLVQRGHTNTRGVTGTSFSVCLSRWANIKRLLKSKLYSHFFLQEEEEGKKKQVSKEPEYAYDMNISTLGTEATGQKMETKQHATINTSAYTDQLLLPTSSTFLRQTMHVCLS